MFGEGTELGWNVATKEDFQYHTIYRSGSTAVDETAILIDYTTAPGYDGTGQAHDYIDVATSDHVGNERDTAGVGNEISSIRNGSPTVTAFTRRRTGTRTEDTRFDQRVTCGRFALDHVG